MGHKPTDLSNLSARTKSIVQTLEDIYEMAVSKCVFYFFKETMHSEIKTII
jgi:hypothetical protein